MHVGCSLGGSARMPHPSHYEAGRAFLVGTATEARGYGLYSYVLFAGPPTPATQEGYRQAVTAYLEYVPPVAQLEQQVPRDRLNMTYMPITAPPPANVVSFPPKLGDAGASAAAATWVLEHYNYGRARLLLAALGKQRGDGPYLISCLQPLSAVEQLPGGYLRQNLSGVPSEFMRSWLREFLQQSGAPEEWNRTSLTRFVLTLRTAAVVVARAWPDVRNSVSERIAIAQ